MLLYLHVSMYMYGYPPSFSAAIRFSKPRSLTSDSIINSRFILAYIISYLIYKGFNVISNNLRILLSKY